MVLAALCFPVAVVVVVFGTVEVLTVLVIDELRWKEELVISDTVVEALRSRLGMIVKSGAVVVVPVHVLLLCCKVVPTVESGTVVADVSMVVV